MTKPPRQLRVSRDRATLNVLFADDRAEAFSAEMLRVLSPSAEVQGHSPEQRVTVPGKRAVTIDAVEPVGNYAVRIVFSDGHDTGFYSWRYLRDLAEDRQARWQAYLDELQAKGLSRDG